MRIVVMGTGPFAAPTFEKLIDAGHEIPLLVTQPIRNRRKSPPNLMRDIAARQQIKIYDPASINTPDGVSVLSRFEPELFFVCDYGQILKPEILAVARHGGINLHASLLPKYRGAAPINWAIYHGEQETGVTVIHMTAKIDAGPNVAQAKVTIKPEETAETLEPRLAKLGAPLVCQVVDQFADAGPQEIVQDSTLVTKAPRLKKTDGLIQWNQSAQQIINHLRAMQPWPRTYTFWQRTGEQPMRLNLDSLQLVDTPIPTGTDPGVIIQANKQELIIATGSSALQINTVQPAGKRIMAADEFLRGYPLKEADRFGPDE